MAIVSGVMRFLCKPFVKPTDLAWVGANLVKLTGRTIAISALSAITSAILNKCAKQEGPLPALTSHLLKISVSTAATAAAICFCYLYVGIKSNKNYVKANRDTIRFEKIITYTGAIASLSTLFIAAVFKRNEIVMSIARHSRLPLIACTTTALIISFFHTHQMKKLNQTQ